MSLPKSGLFVPNRIHPVTRFTLPVLALPWIPIIWWFKKHLTINSIRCHGSMRSACRHCVAIDLYFSVPCIRKPLRRKRPNPYPALEYQRSYLKYRQICHNSIVFISFFVTTFRTKLHVLFCKKLNK
jgi:hypothetical protein